MLKTFTIRERGEGRYDLRPSIPGACYDVSNVPAASLGAEIAALAAAGWTTVATSSKRDRIAAAGGDVSKIHLI